MITDTEIKSPEELSPEWFAESEKFLKENKNTDALTLLEMLQLQISQPPMVDEVEILKHYTGDPNCRFCRGRMRLGINRIYDKNVRLGSYYQLQLCHCAKPVESEYKRIETMLLNLGHKLEDRDRLLLSDNQVLFRNTFFGGIKVWWKQRRAQELRIRKAIQKKCLNGYEALLKLTQRRRTTEPSAEEVRRPAEQG